MRKLICVLLMCLPPAALLAQDQVRKDFISFEPGIGTHIILENKNALNDYIPTFELTYSQTMEHLPQPWVKYSNAKLRSVQFLYLNLSNLDGLADSTPGVYGNFYGIIPGLSFGLINTAYFKMYIYGGVGLAYVSKTYYDNEKNVFIGAHINYVPKFELQMESALTEKLSITLGMRYMHFSNGSYILPNKGINVASAKTGIKWQIR